MEGLDDAARNDSSFPKDKWVHISLVHDRDGTASIFWDGHLKAQGRLPPQARQARQVLRGALALAARPLLQGRDL